MSQPPDVDATELISVRVSPDGCRLKIRVRDGAGRISTIALPTYWLNQVLNALPTPAEAAIYPLDTWSMDRPGQGQDLLLTLRTPEGRAVTFAVKPWQVEGMATIATYGGGTSRGTVH